MSDQWRYDWTSFDLELIKTPTFDRIARLGTRFTRAVVPAPLCKPARAALATGMHYPNSGVVSESKFEDIKPELTTFYEHLRSGGVHTLTVGKDDLTLIKPGTQEKLGFSDGARCYGKDVASHVKKPIEAYMQHLDSKGLFADFQQTEMHLCTTLANITTDQYTCPHSADMAFGDYIDNWIASEAQRLIREAPEDKPYFMQVNYAGPHPPLVVTKGMEGNDSALERTWPLAHKSSTLDAATQQLMRGHYATLIEHIEGLNDEILRTMEARGDLNNSYVCVLSDHGEMLGDFWDESPFYEPLQKNAPWQASIGVPMACMGPGITAGRVVEEPVAIVDLASTVLEWQGVEVPSTFEAVSLKGVMEGDAPDDRPVLSGLQYTDHIFSTSQRRFEDGHVYKLVCCVGACPYGRDLRPAAEVPTTGWVRHLFDLTEDPLEDRDLFSGANATILATLGVAMPGLFRDCGVSTEGPSQDVVAGLASVEMSASGAISLEDDEPHHSRSGVMRKGFLQRGGSRMDIEEAAMLQLELRLGANEEMQPEAFVKDEL